MAKFCKGCAYFLTCLSCNLFPYDIPQVILKLTDKNNNEEVEKIVIRKDEDMKEGFRAAWRFMGKMIEILSFIVVFIVICATFMGTIVTLYAQYEDLSETEA